jgi:hypothetical protein
MSLMTFNDFLKDQRPPSEPQTNAFPDEITILGEAFSPNLVKTAAVGILMKVNQLRQNIAQDRTANSTDKSLANMLFLLTSMLAVAIGAMSDPVLVNRSKGSASR